MSKQPYKSISSSISKGVYDRHTEGAIERLKGPESKALSANRRGALFSLGLIKPEDRALYRLPIAHRSENAFLDALFDLGSCALDSATDMGSLEERLSLSRPAILKIVSKLIAKQMFAKTSCSYYENRRPVTLYVLIAPSAEDAAKAYVNDPSTQLAMPIGDDLLRQAVQLRYDSVLDQRIPWKGERLIVFNLTALLRTGRTGPSSEYIAIELRQGKRYCRAEARAAAGTKLAGVLDLRPLIVLLTLVRQHLAKLEGRQAENLFRIYLRDICDAMALTPSSSNVRAIYAQLARWRHTSYTIIDDIYGMLDWAKEVAEVGRDFSVFSGLDFVTWVGDEGITPELIQISLYEPIYRALLESGRALSVHSEILRDRRPHPLVHKLYYWCRRVVQHQHKEREFLLDHVRSEITPNTSLSEFRREICEALTGHAQEGDKNQESFSRTGSSSVWRSAR